MKGGKRERARSSSVAAATGGTLFFLFLLYPYYFFVLHFELFLGSGERGKKKKKKEPASMKQCGYGFGISLFSPLFYSFLHLISRVLGASLCFLLQTRIFNGKKIRFSMGLCMNDFKG